MRRLAPALLGAFLLISPRGEAQFSVLHVHAPGAAIPRSPLARDASGALYGTTSAGGASDLGVLFTIGADGTGYTVLHTFTGGVSDGAHPVGPLVVEGPWVYGTTEQGGAPDIGVGVLYRVRTDGTDFSILHAFTIGPPDGGSPSGVVSDGAGTLYGAASMGGSGQFGIVYKLRTDGSGYTILHSFADDAGGGYAFNPPLLDGAGSLFGTTYGGGASGKGVVFRLATDGSAFAVLHAFTGPDGEAPWAALVRDDSGTLFGTTSKGGGSNSGVVFSIASGGGFTLLHSFAGTDGASPQAALALDGTGRLFGSAASGGPSGGGVLFRVGGDGSEFAVIHAFAGGVADGRSPWVPLLLDASGLVFGAAGQGGDSDRGVLFRMRSDGSGFSLLRTFPNEDGERAGAVALDASGTLYGTTMYGGRYAKGTVFSMKTDGSRYRVLHHFQGGAADGAMPNDVAALVLDGVGNLYGTTWKGGGSDKGVVFALRNDGTGFTLLHSFSVKDGAGLSGLVLDGSGGLVGTAASGGSAGLGVAFRLAADGSGFAVLHEFGGPGDGSSPSPPLAIDAGGTLYGTTSTGGASGRGTIFRTNAEGSGYTLVHSFAAGEGRYPIGGVVLDGSGNLFGTTHQGGASDVGTVYSVRTDGAGYTTLHEFSYSEIYPYGSPVLAPGGLLVGTTRFCVYSLRADGSEYTIVHLFSGADGQEPHGRLVRDAAAIFYGATVGGGAPDQGVEFRVGPLGPVPVELTNFAAD